MQFTKQEGVKGGGTTVRAELWVTHITYVSEPFPVLYQVVFASNPNVEQVLQRFLWQEDFVHHIQMLKVTLCIWMITKVP